MCKDALKSWLEPKVPNSGFVLNIEESVPSGYDNLSIGAVAAEPRKYKFLYFTNSDGMNVIVTLGTQVTTNISRWKYGYNFVLGGYVFRNIQ